MNECSRANYSRAKIPIRKWVQHHYLLRVPAPTPPVTVKGQVMCRGRVDALGLGSQQTCLSLIPGRSHRCYIQPLLWIAERDGNRFRVSGAEGDVWARDGDPPCIHGLGCSFLPGWESQTRVHLQSKLSTAGPAGGLCRAGYCSLSADIY